jgi:TRAP-type transport system small permease protein
MLPKMGLISRIANAQLLLAIAALIVMGSVTVCDVALKYLFNHPIIGAYDVVEVLLPVIVFHGMPATLMRRQNIVIDLIDHVAGPERTRLLITASDLIIASLLALITWAMIPPARQAYEYGDRKIELGLPIAVVWAMVVLGMVGSLFVVLQLIFAPPSKSAKSELR